MYIALTNVIENREVVCTGDSVGQVRRKLVQMGLNWEDYVIIDPEIESQEYTPVAQ